MNALAEHKAGTPQALPGSGVFAKSDDYLIDELTLSQETARVNKPKRTNVIPMNIPETLRGMRNWVLWRYDFDERGKWTKVPYHARYTARKAKSNDSTTWSPYDTALAGYENTSNVDGIGFVPSINDTVTAIDIDDCIDEAGNIAPWAQEIITLIDSYTEISPSGKGIRIFFLGKLPGTGRKKAGLEVYDKGHYLTVTGHHIPSTPSDIQSRQQQLDTFMDKYFKEDPGPDTNYEPGESVLTDDVVIEKASAATNGDKFKTLWEGNTSGYSSPSEADSALCFILAFWTGKDPSQMDRLFRTSGLYRDKWDEKHGAKTYGQMTIERAISKCNETYSPPVQEEKAAGNEWQEPILFGEIGTQEIPCGLLPGYVGKYAQAVTDSTQTPPGLAVMLSISALAACLQKRFEVSPYQDDYTEPLSLWTATASDPGTRKTAVKNAITAPLMEWERQKIEDLRDRINDTNLTRTLNEKRIDQLMTRASKPNVSDEDREQYRKDIQRIKSETPDEIKVPKIWTDDSTPERLQDMMADNGERMALLSDEGGIFEVMAGLYTGGRVNMNVFLQGHAGAPVRVDRQGRTVTLDKPALTFGLAVQPGIVNDLGQGNKSKFRYNGTLARFLYCVPKSTVGHRDITKRSVVPGEVREAYHRGLHELLDTEPVYDEHGKERARILTLKPEALKDWERFSQYIESKQGTDGEFCGIQDWTNKLPGAALRIAGLMHVVEHGATDPKIGRDTMGKALDLCEILIGHAQAAFDLMGDDPAHNDAKIILQWIKTNNAPTFKQNSIFVDLRRFRNIERVEKALRVLIGRHIISEPRKVKTGGRPSIVYGVNPEILENRE